MTLQQPSVRLFLAAFAAGLAFSTPALAIVSFTGDMAPADSPFTSTNEGINGDGNFVRTTLLVTDPEAWRFYETPANIRVGSTGRGQLSLNGGSNLRYHSLMIGGGGQQFLPYPGYPGAQGMMNGEPIPDAQIATRSILNTEPVTGYGTVRVEGFGTVFNNDPQLVPEIYIVALAVAGTPSTASRPTPDITPRDLAEGQDVYVGYTGRGELLVNTGGSVEIQDSLFVGLGPRSNGLVIIDGLSSSLLANGLKDGVRNGSSIGTEGEFPSVIGGYGTGILRVINGAAADFRNGLAIGTWAATGVNGDSPGAQEGGNDITESAIQSGQVYVSGVGSRMTISGDEDGGLAIGEFLPDANAAYPLDYGRGGLTIGPGAAVTVSADDDDNADDVVIGRFGELSLPGGRLSVLGQLTNDGIIKTSGIGEIAVGVQGTIHGAGRIDTGMFFNRTVGEVRVGAGESLQVVSYGTDDLVSVRDDARMANVGYIEVIRGELAFDRSNSTPVFSDRFQNTFLIVDPMDPTTNVRGRIVSNGGTLRFGSDLSNLADLNFIGGENLVTGQVFNEADGKITVGGNGTSVTFTDNMNNAGVIDLSPESSVVQFLGDMNTTGTINLTLASRQAGNGHISVAGDLGLGGTLNVQISDPNIPGTIPLQPTDGDAFELMSATGELNLIPGFNWTVPTYPDLFLFVDPDLALDTVTLRVQGNPPIGADFNGDGIVDAADLAIWQNNFGEIAGVSGFTGDADLDGDVDGDDLVVIVDQIGGPGMVPSLVAALPSSTPNSTAIPEPGTVGLAAMGLLALLVRRRR